MVSTTGLLILASACIAGGLAFEWRNLRTTFTLFHDIPLTLEGLRQSNNYSLMVRDHDLKLNYFAFKNDPRVAVGIDSYGNIGGIRVSYIKSDLPTRGLSNNLTFPAYYEDKPFYTSGTFLNTDVWYTDVLFVHPDVLRAGGRRETGGLVGEDVFLKLDGEWLSLPKYECDATAKGFTLQSCYPIMGLHYFYKISTETSCNTMQPAFGLYENGELIGLGVAAVGSQTATQDRTWLEDAPKDVFSTIVSNRPDCLIPWLEQYGLTALHFFFKEDPTTTACPESVCQA